jgi:predicted N-acetyltransferase YhbS
MNIKIRNEVESDYRRVEEITREAFWNRYMPGCNEHFVLNNLRKSDDFITELDFVAEIDGEIVGNIVYSKSKVIDYSGNIRDVITFGPVSVLPKYQNQGIGGKLIRHSIEVATNMGFSAILIYGDPRYYSRFGFRCAEKYDITSEDGKFSVALMMLPLNIDALGNAKGRFKESKAFEVDETEFEVFESTFKPKTKEITESQKVFEILCSLRY